MFRERLQADTFPRRFSHFRSQGGFRTRHRVTCQLVSHNGPNMDKLHDVPESLRGTYFNSLKCHVNRFSILPSEVGFILSTVLVLRSAG